MSKVKMPFSGCWTRKQNKFYHYGMFKMKIFQRFLPSLAQCINKKNNIWFTSKYMYIKQCACERSLVTLIMCDVIFFNAKAIQQYNNGSLSHKPTNQHYISNIEWTVNSYNKRWKTIKTKNKKENKKDKQAVRHCHTSLRDLNNECF